MFALWNTSRERIEQLSSNIVHLDDKIEKQLERRGEVERMEKRLEALQYFIEESDLKIDKLQRREEYVDRVESRLDQLHNLLERIEERILDVTKERAGFEAQEKRLQQMMSHFQESFEQGEVHLASVREAHRTMEQVSDFLGKLDEGLKELQSGEVRMDTLRQRLKEQEEGS